jgi:hypothetical protein
MRIYICVHLRSSVAGIKAKATEPVNFVVIKLKE